VKPAFWIWLLSAPVLTGMLITVLLMMPSLASSLGMWIAIAAGVSAVVAVPFSMAVGKAMT
jgi:hypothetical protein